MSEVQPAEPHGHFAQLRGHGANKGFATIPKTMPIILQIMDDLSNGKPVSSTYLGLWCDTWDNSMVNVSKPAEMAHAAGFSGQRAAYTWGGRIKILQDLRFIDVKAGKSGPISHVLIWNSAPRYPLALQPDTQAPRNQVQCPRGSSHRNWGERYDR